MRQLQLPDWSYESMFQFTHPVWGATSATRYIEATRACFNSRTPCGVRRGARDLWILSSRFNSRTPCGVRQQINYSYEPEMIVSIHAPRVGCDLGLPYHGMSNLRFNSRTPCGVRLKLRYIGGIQCIRFNSRTPCGVRHSQDS